jgi:hypothetical protein
MKKFSLFTSVLAAATLSLVTTQVCADPIRVQSDFTCPSINMVSNFGSYIAGLGEEAVLSQHNPVYFRSHHFPVGVPDSLSSYSNYSTDYNSVTAYVTCSYVSSEPMQLPFDLTYYVTNGLGGRVVSQTSNTINIIFSIGYK